MRCIQIYKIILYCTNQVLRSLLCVLFVMVPFVLMCVDYNPFQDETNARAILVTDLNDGDTVSIFATETLSVVLTVSSLVKQIALHVDSNRFFTDTLIKIDRDLSGSDPYRFRISFWDTGWHQIRVITTRNSGDQIFEHMKLYAQSPLNQKSITGVMGDSILLQTEPVRDRDVLYHWSFGKSISIESVPPSTRQVVRVGGSGKIGEIWVSDLTGRYASPRHKFTYSFSDNDGPEILCTNEGSIGKDTIIASDKDFFLRMRIHDNGSGSVYSAFVNGAPFDAINGMVYIKKVPRVDTLQQPFSLTVTATDPFSNTTVKQFYLLYDSTTSFKTQPRIKVTVPSYDSLSTGKKRWNIMGLIENFSSDSFNLTMNVRVNNSQAAAPLHVKGRVVAGWNFTIDLSGFSNTIQLFATDAAGTRVADTSFVMFFYQNYTDTAPPVLVELSVNRVQIPPEGLVIAESDAILRVIAFDEGSGVKRVTLNGAEMAALPEGHGYIWEKPIAVDHTESGSSYTVEITDNVDQKTQKTVVLRQNRLPRIITAPHPPFPLLIGTLYRDTLVAVDPDNDIVEFQKSNGPERLTVDRYTGVIDWTPAAGDTGTHHVSILIKDVFSGTIPCEFSIRVTDMSAIPDPVRFLTTEAAFPKIAKINQVIDIGLHLVPGTGFTPFTYDARKVSGEASNMRVENQRFKWLPQATDTGYQYIVVTVTDTLNTSAYLYPVIKIVDPGRVLSVSSHWSGPGSSEGVLDMSSSLTPETLTISIDNFDDHEEYQVIWQLAGVSRTVVPDSGRVRIIINPAGKRGSATLDFFLIDDVAGTIIKNWIVNFGNPPGRPQCVTPVNNSVIQDGTVTITWSGDDPDNNTLVYDLFLAAEDSQFVKVAHDLSEPSFSINLLKAGTYYWKVIASDAKWSSGSDSYSFIVKPLNPVRFSTTISDFPSVLMANERFILNLQVDSSTGKPPYTLSMISSGTSLPSIDGDSLVWDVGMDDTGYCKLSIMVHDSAGNSDMLEPLILVTAENAPFELTDIHTIPVNAEEELDMRSSCQPETLFISISDPDPLEIEQYSIRVVLLHTEYYKTADMNRKFMIIIDPSSSTRVRDTLSIYVTDKGGHSDSLIYPLYYGHPLDTPSSPTPAAGTLADSLSVTLSWVCSNPDSSLLSYRVYLGADESELMVLGTTEACSLQTGNLNPAIPYYWRVVVSDGCEEVEGPVWYFETGD